MCQGSGPPLGSGGCTSVPYGIERVQRAFVHVFKRVEIAFGRTYAAVSHSLLHGLEVSAARQ
jgi:hypothetical protein